ncbi:MAG: hypothetical protein MJ192_01495 [Clostridia bacterium]|nr:hypothetical protein [Clostridia bacterium]
MANRYELPLDDERTVLREGVIRALRAVPLYFKSTINIEGVTITDLFSANSLLGGAIEEQTIITLNEVRSIWDPDGKWNNYSFRRYPESFPDVRLENNEDDKPLIGIELKGWYLLAKEQEPSFRFQASAGAMTVWDLIAVFPWHFSNVISGKPVLEAPFIEQAKYAADLRTEYWESRSKSAMKVEHPDIQPYPKAGSKYSDVVHDDAGNNFGRIARIKGLMDTWVSDTMRTPLGGIEARWWVQFFLLFKEDCNEDKIKSQFIKLAKNAQYDSEKADKLFDYLQSIKNIL